MDTRSTDTVPTPNVSSSVTPQRAVDAVRQATLDMAGIELWDTDEPIMMRPEDRIALTLRVGQFFVILPCQRPAIPSGPIDILQRDPLPVAALFDFQYGKTDATNRIHLVDDDSLRQVVSSKIASFLVEQEITPPLVAGISGGGDSNTLVQGIRRYLESSSLPTDRVVCFTLVMDPALVHLLHYALSGRPSPAAVDLSDARYPPAHDRPWRMARAVTHPRNPAHAHGPG